MPLNEVVKTGRNIPLILLESYRSTISYNNSVNDTQFLVFKTAVSYLNDWVEIVQLEQHTRVIAESDRLPFALFYVPLYLVAAAMHTDTIISRQEPHEHKGSMALGASPRLGRHLDRRGSSSGRPGGRSMGDAERWLYY